MPFEAKELVLRIQINEYRDEAQIEVVGCPGPTAEAAFIACGRTNKLKNTLDPTFEFAGRLLGNQLDTLKTALRAFLAALEGDQSERESK